MLPASKPSTSFGKMTGLLHFDFGLSCLIPTSLKTLNTWLVTFSTFQCTKPVWLFFCVVFTLIYVLFWLLHNFLEFLVVCLEFIVPLENFSLHYRWRAANFDLGSALNVFEQWGFFSVPHLLWHGTSYYMGISQDPWHSHLFPSVWQLICHCAWIRTPNLPLAGRTL